MSPRRTSFIARNWKMYKTIEQAERYVQALLPGASLDPESFAHIVEVASGVVVAAR
jgi:triosephosphate isomerase